MRTNNLIKTFILSTLLAFGANVFASASTSISDSAITAAVKAKIVADKSVSALKVDVSTSDSIVMLAGEVDSDTDAGALIELTQATKGVQDVNTSELKVKNSKQPFTDTVITAKTKGILMREKLFGKNVPVRISVETNNGVVYLSGHVKNKKQLENAIRLAKAINGVKEVKSRLKVSH